MTRRSQARWASSYDPSARDVPQRFSKAQMGRFQARAAADRAVHRMKATGGILALAEDTTEDTTAVFAGHHVVRVPLPNMCYINPYYNTCIEWIRKFCADHGIVVVAQIAAFHHKSDASHPFWLMVTFASRFHAAKFKMLWCGWGENTLYVVELLTPPSRERPFGERVTHIVTFDRTVASNNLLVMSKRIGSDNVRLFEIDTSSDLPE